MDLQFTANKKSDSGAYGFKCHAGRQIREGAQAISVSLGGCVHICGFVSAK